MIEYLLIITVGFLGWKMFDSPRVIWILLYWLASIILILALFSRECL